MPAVIWKWNKKISRRFKEHIWTAACWHYPNLLMDSWSNPTPRVFGVINLETIPGSYGICAEALIKSQQSMPPTFSGVLLFSQTEEEDMSAVSSFRQQWEL